MGKGWSFMLHPWVVAKRFASGYARAVEPAPIASYPIRKSQWRSFAIGVLASLLAVAIGVLVVALFVAVPVLDGAVVIILALCMAGAAFFGSVPAQRRLSRAWDARDPHVVHSEAGITVPNAVGTPTVLPFRADTLAAFGSFVYRTHSGRNGVGSLGSTGSRQIFALLRAAGTSLVLYADDDGEGATLRSRVDAWPTAATPEAPARIRLWARDLIALVETLRNAP